MTEAINMVLTGMPGSGKSFLGRLMAAASGREFIDMDSHIEHTVGESIPDIITGRGEEAFRELEVEAARALCRRSGLVIATGGGTVLRREGMEALPYVVVFTSPRHYPSRYPFGFPQHILSNRHYHTIHQQP